MERTFWRHSIQLLLAALLVVGGGPAAPLEGVWGAPGAQYTVGDCNRVEQEQLRDELEAHVLAVLEEPGEALEIEALVEQAWQKVGMDAAIDGEVARAVAALSQSEEYLNRLLSSWWAEKAEEYATRIADDAFTSEGFRAKMDELAAAVGAAVAAQAQSRFSRAASVALLCLQSYVGERYSATFFALFAEQVRQETQDLDLAALNRPEVSILAEHQGTLAGVSTILVTQLISRLSQKLGEKLAQRVAGRVVGRILGRAGSSLIPIAGWVVGIGLIVYDLWEGGQGALPQIQEGLQSDEVKEKLRQEVVVAVRDDLPDQAALIALESAVSLTEQWQGFCDRYDYVCLVAEESEPFRRLLQEVALDELESVTALVNFYMSQLGRAELDRALAEGSFGLLLTMPAASLVVLQETGSTADTLAWAVLAGDGLGRVAEWGLHRWVKPDELSSEQFAALVALDDPAGVQKLLALSSPKRRVLLALPGSTLGELVAEQEESDLDWFAGYLLLPDLQPGKSAAAVGAEIAAEVVDGRLTVAELRSPAPSAAVQSPLPTATEVAARAPAAAEGLPLLPGLVVLAVLAVLAVAGWLVARRKA
ncbi:MAG: hypothetical protein KGS73_09210 [Chloroflexi bacterium]|nr:hypothetical protein [Chloroflexota bacterium]